MKLIAVAVLALVIGGALAWWWKPAPPAGPPQIVTDTLWMEKERPKVEKPSLGARLTTTAVKPTQTRRADQPSAAGKASVERYCAPVTAKPDSGKADSSKSPILRYQLPDFGGKKAGPRLTLFSTLGDGRRWSADYKARGRIQWLSSGDSVIVRGDRLWVRLLRGGAKCAPVAAASGGAGALLDSEDRLRGFFIGSLSTVVGCLL